MILQTNHLDDELTFVENVFDLKCLSGLKIVKLSIFKRHANYARF